MKPRVVIRVVPHAEQRYATCGDWQFTYAGDLRISVSAMRDERHEQLVAVHELIEALCCRAWGVPQKAVDAFDLLYEQRRRESDLSEPGDDPGAPYHRQHVFAAKIERMVADELGVDWDAYAKEVEEL